MIGGIAAILTKPSEPEWGATYSKTYAEMLQIDWREGFLATLSDLNLRHIRLPAYWSSIETEPGVYNFEDLDWMMDEALKRDVDITMALGAKVPRWPECYVPEWIDLEDEVELEASLSRFIEKVVTRYKDNDALAVWQVENEPFFPFGVCPQPNIERVFNEIKYVKSLDPNHPIQRTTSGEQSVWLYNIYGADILGASLYRIVFTEPIGYNVFPLSPIYYRIQSAIISPFVEKVVISELQVEPWFSEESAEMSLEEKYQLFTVEDLYNHMSFARSVGAGEVYFWGVEWWYFLKENGDGRLWEAAEVLTKQE